MLDVLKKLATDKLTEIMASNSLSGEATSEAAQEGTSALIGNIMDKVKSGNLSDIQELFSNEGKSTEENPVTSQLKTKMQDILQQKGMSADDALSEAGNVVPSLIESVKEKFLSNKAEDSAFNISDIAGLLGGDAGGLLNKVKGLF